ncbi:Aldose 1-epimerase [Operophtera brumata]|uniref:Galactose mutarotase n=1 Tax=Operophtera brumata TaxID=104452 RepID=A0A0L7K3R6_OPEBR|nr:Aldose 1-epimerase [Operophtera brumata]
MVTLTVEDFGTHNEQTVPDQNGVTSDIVLGFDDLDSYVSRNVPYLGAAVGRCANRIGGATFDIDGKSHWLIKNIGEDHLHGGTEGYPGDLLTNVTYDVTEENTFLMNFTASASKKTVVNLTNHSYFNLAGHDAGSEGLYDHVGGTAFDLRSATKLGDAMNKGHALFDDNFCVSTYGNKGLNFVSRVIHPPSGRTLELYSNQPGVQLYTGNFLPEASEPALIGKSGNYPDAVHHANFPSAVLRPGDVYKHDVVYKFGVEKCQETHPHVVSA